MSVAPAKPFVIVLIPTFRRPDQLRFLLDRLADQQDAPDIAILVADNDGGGRAGLAMVETVRAAGYRWPLEGFLVEERGLCSVRNALFARAVRDPRMTHVALIDDDEWPDHAWLTTLIQQQLTTDADAVSGPVRAIFEDRPRWAGETFLFRPEQRPEGIVDMLWGTNNTLATRACIETTAPPWFDPAYNTTGGEDLDLFTRWRRAGKRFAWAGEAWVSERVPPDRARLAWVMRRLWRIGCTDSMVSWKYAGVAGRCALVLRRMVMFGVATLALPLALIPGTNRVDHLGRWVRACGRIAGLLGGRYREYG